MKINLIFCLPQLIGCSCIVTIWRKLLKYYSQYTEILFALFRFINSLCLIFKRETYFKFHSGKSKLFIFHDIISLLQLHHQTRCKDAPRVPNSEITVSLGARIET